MGHHGGSVYQSEEAGDSLFNQQYTDELGLTNLAQVQAQQTQNVVAGLAVSGENELRTIADA